MTPERLAFIEKMIAAGVLLSPEIGQELVAAIRAREQAALPQPEPASLGTTPNTDPSPKQPEIPE